MTKHSYKEGEFVFKEGDPSHFACRITSGEVEVIKEIDNQTVVLGIVKTGEFLGEMGVIEGRPRSATARTKTDVTADLISKEEFLRLMSEDTESAYQLIARLCERLRTVDQKLAEATVSKDVRTYSFADISEPKDSSSLTVYEEAPVDGHALGLKILPNSDLVAAGFPSEGLSVTDFPFHVGRQPQPKESAPYLKINLSVQDNPPYRLSRVHFSIEKTQQGFLVRDLGSTLGTQVNGEFLGNDFARDFRQLESGENSVIAGGLGSPFVFRVMIA